MYPGCLARLPVPKPCLIFGRTALYMLWLTCFCLGNIIARSIIPWEAQTHAWHRGIILVYSIVFMYDILPTLAVYLTLFLLEPGIFTFSSLSYSPAYRLECPCHRYCPIRAWARFQWEDPG